jgi:hypothetical protein
MAIAFFTADFAPCAPLWVADGIAERARKMAEMEEKEWVASVDKWNAEVDRRERMGGIAKAAPGDAQIPPLNAP